MKKIFNLVILTGLVSVSCEGPTAPGNSVESGHESLTKQLLVSSGEWTTEVKSVYVPGEGITLTGDEKLAVYYNAWSESVEDQAAKGFTKKNEIVMAEPSDGDSYAFTHAALAEAEKYNYYFVMPYRQLQTVATHDGISKACWNLRTVQYPSATSYDPTFDYLIGKPAENVGKSETVEVSAFKRIVAPFKLTVNDPSGLLDGEKIHAVTVDFPEGDYVAGKVYIDFDQDYDETGIAAKYNAYSGTALTAVYPEGLSPVAGAYDVWYVALPASFQAGQKVSVTVTGETKTVTCSASLPSAVGLVADKFNSLSFGLSETKEDYESTQSLHFDFSGLTSVKSTDFSASDGKVYSFTNNGCLHYGTSKAPITSGLKIKPGNKLTLPEVEGKAISGVRVYTHEESWSSSSSKATLTASAGTVNTSALYDPQTAGGFPQGYVDLIFSEPQSGAVDLTVAFSDNATSHNAVLTSVSLYLVEDKVEQPDVINDYYTAYTQGKTLTFGDLTISNKTHTDASLIDAAGLTYDMMKDGGVYFINPSSDYVTLQGNNSTYTVADGAELILIGRYADNQPKIQVKELRANAEDLTVINVNFRSSATNQMICKSTGTETSSTVSFFDCMISSSATSFKYLIRDYQGESASAPFTEMVFDNCIIDVTKMTTAFYYASPSAVSVPQSLSITDNVIYSSNTLTSQYLLNGTSLSTLAVVVSGNTIVNFYPGSGLICVPTLASLEVLSNVFYCSGQDSISSPAVTRLDTAPSGAFTVSDNIMSAVGCNKSWRTYRFNNIAPTTDTNNTAMTTSPFTSAIDASKGYFPISSGTAGASYSDKPYFKIK